MGLPQPKVPFDRQDYFAWETQQPTKNEYVAGEVFAMVGARQEHALVALALAARFREHLRGTRCRAYPTDMKLEVEAADAVFYPDVFVTCDPRDRSPDADLVKQHPLLIVEVLSDSTAAYDRGRKFELYRRLPELQEVLFVDQERLQIDLFRRNGQGRWELYPAGEGELLRLDSLGLDLPVQQVYDGVLPQAVGADGGAQGSPA